MEAEREKFRAYVESSGLMSALTNVLVTLYEEPNKPEDALTYLIKTLSAKSSEGKKIEFLEEKVKALEAEIQELKEQLANANQSEAVREKLASTAISEGDSVKE